MPDDTTDYAVFETAHGFCGVAWTAAGVARFQLPTSNASAAERLLLRRLARAGRGAPPPDVVDVIDAATRCFEGERLDFSGVALDLSDQEPLFQDIYAATRRVGWGATTTYGAIAKDIGAGPEAARDVGQAMARNPVALIIPCRRVPAAGGRIGGFSAPGGSAAKLRMLELEGAPFGSPEPAQQSLAL